MGEHAGELLLLLPPPLLPPPPLSPPLEPDGTHTATSITLDKALLLRMVNDCRAVPDGKATEIQPPCPAMATE